jgi:hypothetical protein
LRAGNLLLTRNIGKLQTLPIYWALRKSTHIYKGILMLFHRWRRVIHSSLLKKICIRISVFFGHAIPIKSARLINSALVINNAPIVISGLTRRRHDATETCKPGNPFEDPLVHGMHERTRKRTLENPQAVSTKD